MSAHQDVNLSACAKVLANYWLSDYTPTIVGYWYQVATAKHLQRLYSLIVLSTDPDGNLFFLAHLYRHSKKRQWEPVYIEYALGSDSQFDNHRHFDHYPTQQELEDFLSSTKWELDSSFTILEDTVFTKC